MTEATGSHRDAEEQRRTEDEPGGSTARREATCAVGLGWIREPVVLFLVRGSIRSDGASRPATQAEPSNRHLCASSVTPFLFVIPFAP
jgi:hypothetical protein